jgi:hypothetical protein
MALGARLKHWRVRENLKIAEVAAKLGGLHRHLEALGNRAASAVR